MGSTDSEKKQPRSILFHPIDFAEWLQQRMGMINAQEMYSNEFLRMKDVWFMLTTTQEAIRQGVINLKDRPELHLNKDALYKLDKIYNGGCYLAVKRDDEGLRILSRKFYYKEPEQQQGIEIIRLPALKNLNPVGSTTQKNWNIRIRESVPFKYVFEGYSYAEVINEGGFAFMFNDRTEPKFSAQDMYSLHKKTKDVSREYYNQTVDILNKFWQKQWNILSVNTHKIIVHLKLGKFKKAEKQNKSLIGDDE